MLCFFQPEHFANVFVKACEHPSNDEICDFVASQACKLAHGFKGQAPCGPHRHLVLNTSPAMLNGEHLTHHIVSW